MQRTKIFFLIVTLIVLGSLAIAQEPTAIELFRQANARMESHDYSGALALYRQSLARDPNSESAMYNAGMAAFFVSDYVTAADMWNNVKRRAPDDWQVRAKLIQTYQALGKIEERDKERRELIDLRQRGEIPTLNKAVEFCRDQFSAGGRRIMAFENFEFKGELKVRYSFVVLDDAGKQDYVLSLGSYDVTNAVWAEQKKNKKLAEKGQRLFHLDGYWPSRHATYGFYTPEPSYDDIRKEVVKVLENQVKPASSTTLTKDGANVNISAP